MRVNPVTMVLVGMGVWLLALVVLVIADLAGHDLRYGIHICLAGLGFGVAALAWAVPVHRRNTARAQQTARQGEANTNAGR